MDNFTLTEEQKAKILPHIKASIKSAFLAGVEVGLAVAQNTENKIDDVVLPVLSGPANEMVDKLLEGIKL
jgi:hypothetical protein